MSIVDSPDLRIEELAAGASLGDLTDAELHEIKAFDTEIFQSMVERYEEAAARTYLTFQGTVPTESMPAELTVRLKNMASGFLDAPSKLDASQPTPVRPSTLAPAVAPSSMGLREIAAWLCVAASVAFALNVSLLGKSVRSFTLQQQRDTFLASASDVLRSKWESTSPDEKPGIDRGDVVWSSAAQQGFMTIKGLPVNDASKEQYQLWIIDPTRDEKPVDGGVFNIASTGESIVPIQAKLRVDKPSVFAITVEKPGGVVVSDQKRLPLLAKIALN